MISNAHNYCLIGCLPSSFVSAECGVCRVHGLVGLNDNIKLIIIISQFKQTLIFEFKSGEFEFNFF